MRPVLHARSRFEGPRAGGALVLAMVVVVVVAAMAAAFLQLNASLTRRQSSAVHTKRAFYMAEAGLAEAYAGLLIGKTGNVGTENQPASFGEGLFWVVATELPDGSVELESTGMVGNGRALLSMVVEPAATSVSSLGFFADESMDLQPGTLIDAYDSRDGYDSGGGSGGLLAGFGAVSGGEPAGAGASARVGSNGTLSATGTAREPTTVEGDVFPGPEGILTVDGTVTITGSTDPSPAAASLPPVEVPTGVTWAAGCDHSGAAPIVLTAPSGSLDFLRVRPGAQVVVLGPAELLVRELVVEAQGDLVLDATAGAIDIVVAEHLELAEGSSLTTPAEDPTLVSLQVAGDPVEPVLLAARSCFHGLVYAPEAAVEVHAPFEVFGSLVGDRLDFVGAVKLHFDTYMPEVEAREALPSILSWRIVELETRGAPSLNPFEILGVDPALCPPPSDAHEDQQLDIVYTPAGGGPDATYSGPESGFDWGAVGTVKHLERDGERAPSKGTEELLKGPIPLGGGGAMQVLDPLVDTIQNSAMSSADLKSYLIDRSPLTNEQLIAAVDRSPAMDSNDLRDVIKESYPLDASIYLAIAARATPMDSVNIKDLFADTSPVPDPSVLGAFIQNPPIMASGDLRDTLLDNSPLPAAVLTKLTTFLPAPLSPSDLSDVLGAQ